MLVTDDEIVAASVMRERPWAGVLPTVDAEAEDALEAAAVRGARSLAIRGLLASDRTFGPEAEDLRRAADGDVRVLVYAAAEQRPLIPVAASVSLIRSGSSWLLDVTSPEGTHDLTPVDDEAGAWRAIENLIGTAGALPEERVLSVIAVPTDDVGALFVSIHGDQAIAVPLTVAVSDGPGTLAATTTTDAIELIRRTASL